MEYGALCRHGVRDGPTGKVVKTHRCKEEERSKRWQEQEWVRM